MVQAEAFHAESDLSLPTIALYTKFSYVSSLLGSLRAFIGLPTLFTLTKTKLANLGCDNRQYASVAFTRHTIQNLAHDSKPSHQAITHSRHLPLLSHCIDSNGADTVYSFRFLTVAACRLVSTGG